MLGGFEYNPGAHAALMENVQNTYQSDIPWYSAMYNTTGLKAFRNWRSRGSLCDQLGPAAAKNLEKLYRESILRTFAAKSVDDFTEDFWRS
jgi:hypothetical protein